MKISRHDFININRQKWGCSFYLLYEACGMEFEVSRKSITNTNNKRKVNSLLQLKVEH